MPKETFISRFSLIIKRLEKGPATYEQIVRYLEDEADIQDRDFSISKRTLQRDIKDIASQLGIEIVNEKKGDKRYFIKNKPETQEHGQRLLESYQVINAINASQDYAEFVFLETRKPKGLEHFYGLLFAIRNKRIVNFTHTKYWDDTVTKRTVHPLALKESQGRWYLAAVDTKDNRLKTFGLDRMEDIDISKTRYKDKYSYNIGELYTHAFGIINEEGKKPETVQLKFTYEQGQYVKTYPLHTSQKIVSETADNVIVEVCLYISYDFIKELLSYAEELEVIKPAQLRTRMKNHLKNSLKLYS
jgi:proteasome accessory factor B